MNTTELFEQTIRKHELVRPGETVVLGVSGGPDSVFLFHAFLRLAKKTDLRLVTAHFNHRLRAAADADERFVRRLSEHHGIPFRSRTEEIAKTRRGTGLSLEEHARKRRHLFFREVKTVTGASAIALGHNRDDRIETFLMRVFCGAGLSGLNAIRPSSGPVIHPLLAIPKKEILDWLRERKIRFRTDRSNGDISLPRNLIRGRILPLVERNYKMCRENIANLMEIVADEDAFVASSAQAVPGALEARIFSRLPVALQRRVVMSLMESPDFRSVETVRLGFLADGPANRVLLRKPGVSFLRRHGTLAAASDAETDRAPFTVEIRSGERVGLPGTGRVLSAETVDRNQVTLRDRESLVFDVDRLEFPLTVRSRRPGDRLRPIGSGGSRKLKEILIDLKIPRWERDRVPVVVSGGRVAGVFLNLAKPGSYNYISSEFSVGPGTRKVLRLTLGE